MRLCVTTTAILMAAGTVQAGGFGEDFSTEGSFFLGLTDRTPGADVFAVGNATARLSFGRIGGELGVYGRADALDTPHETYGALTYRFGDNGQIAVGVPRPAYDGFARSQLELAFPSLGIDRTQLTRSAATHGAMFANWLPYGVSLSNETAGLRYGVSVHSASAPGATVVGVGAQTVLGDWSVSGAIEPVDGAVSAKAQIERDLGNVRAGIGFYAPQAAGLSDLVEGYATFKPLDRIGLTTVVQVPVDGSAATGGLSARYEFTDTTGISLGVATDAGSNAVYNAFVGFEF